MRVLITDPAEADLEDIADYIAKDSPVRALSLVSELYDHCMALGEYPERYPVFSSRQGREVRRCPHGSYLIFYSVSAHEVEVHHIVHAARDYLRLLFPDT